jgi:hypothetical protein
MRATTKINRRKLKMLLGHHPHFRWLLKGHNGKEPTNNKTNKIAIAHR